MSVDLVIHKDPFRIHLDVDRSVIDPCGTIFEVLLERGLCVQGEGAIERVGTYFVMLNGEAILYKDWNTVLREEDFLQVVHLPRGGGGSNVSNILTAIVIAVMAYFTFGLSLYATMAVGAAAYVGMTMMTGAVPAPSASLGNMSRGSSSPTYSLNAQGNAARLMEAIPRVYGRMKTYPDLASQPYSEYQGNQQYLYQLFCVSLGRVEIERIDVDDTLLSSFEDAEYQIINPGEQVTLFPDNVITSEAVSSGLTMLPPNHPNYTILGPFAASGPGTQANFIAVDLALPRGAGTISGGQDVSNFTLGFAFEYQAINDAGVPIGPWDMLESRSITLATQDPQMLSYKIPVPAGRYQVRAYRTSNPGNLQSFGDLQWIGMRAYLPSARTYGNVTLIAVAMRATNALNSSTARKLSVISKGLIRRWDPTNGWGPYEYTNLWPWVAADILTDSDYGKGLPTSRLNIQNFYRLAQGAEQRNDRFNAVFDNTTQLWDALSKVCRVGRAVPIYYAGVVDIIRDEPQSIPTAMFQPANIVRGSFETTYNFHNADTPDHVVVEYVNPVTFKPDTVTAYLPGSPREKPYNVELFGCHDRDHAWREGMSMAASNRDRRRDISFAALKPGLLPRYNGLIRISHDVPQWGYSGRVLNFDQATGRIRTSEPVPFTPNVEHWIAIRKRDGSELGPFKAVPDSTIPAAATRTFGLRIDATAAQLATIKLNDSTREDATTYQFGPTERMGLKALVMSSTPDAQGRVVLNCINYAESVYTAENGGNVPPAPPASNLPTTPGAPIVDSVSVNATVTVGQQNIVATPARGALYYTFQAQRAGSDVWIELGVSSEPSIVVNLSPGRWSVRVAATGRAVGPWATWVGDIESTTLPTPTLDILTLTSKLFAIGVSWAFTASTASIAGRVEIWTSPTNNLSNAVRYVTLPYPANAHDITDLGHGERRFVWARVIDTSGRIGNWYNNGVAVTNTASSDPVKIKEALQGQVDESMLAEQVLELINEAGGGSVVVQELINELAAMRTVKTQLAANGKYYQAAIGVGVSNNDGIIQSEIILGASNVYVIDPNNPNDPGKLLFAVTPQGVVMDKAFISQLFVQEIVSQLRFRSEATDSAGNPLIDMDMKNGSFKLRGQQGNITTELDNMGISTFIDGVRRTKIGAFNGT